MEPLYLPMRQAVQKGLSALTRLAEERPLVLTSHGRPVAVMDSPGRREAERAGLREAALVVAGGGQVPGYGRACQVLGVGDDG